MLGHHQRRKHDFHRRGIGQRIAAFLADFDTQSFEQEDQLRDATIGSRQDPDRFPGGIAIDLGGQFRGVLEAGHPSRFAVALLDSPGKSQSEHILAASSWRLRGAENAEQTDSPPLLRTSTCRSDRPSRRRSVSGCRCRLRKVSLTTSSTIGLLR